jgi:hypothetical protein
MVGWVPVSAGDDDREEHGAVGNNNTETSQHQQQNHIELTDPSGAERLLSLIYAHPFDPFADGAGGVDLTGGVDGSSSSGGASAASARDQYVRAEQAKLFNDARARKRQQEQERKRVMADIERDRSRHTSEAFFTALAGGRIDAIASMLARQPALVNALDAGGRTPLLMAAVCGHVEVVEFLAARDADLNGVSLGGETGACARCGVLCCTHLPAPYVGQSLLLLLSHKLLHSPDRKSTSVTAFAPPPPSPPHTHTLATQPPHPHTPPPAYTPSHHRTPTTSTPRGVVARPCQLHGDSSRPRRQR